MRLPVFMGKISYSLYFWHWPVYVFASYYMLDYIPVPIRIILMLLCVVLAIFSWKYIETPIRKKHILKDNNVLLKNIIIFSIIAASIGVLVILSKGASYRFDKNITTLADAPMSRDFNRIKVGEEEFWQIGKIQDIEKSNTMLIGDSHAIAIAPALDALAVESDKSGLLVASAGCFLSGQYLPEMRGLKKCTRRVEAAKILLKNIDNIEIVFLVARWEEKASGKWKKRKVQLNKEMMLRIQEAALIDFVKYVESLGKKAVLFAQVPQVFHGSRNIPSVLARINIHYKDLDMRPTLGQYQDQQNNIIPMLERVESQTNAEVIWPHKELCGDRYCEITDGKVSFYYDDDHLSIYGAERLKTLFEKYFK